MFFYFLGTFFFTSFGLLWLLWMFGTFQHLLCIFGASLPAVVWTVLLLYCFLKLSAFCFLGHCLGMFQYFKDYFDDLKKTVANLILFHALFCCCMFWPYYGVFFLRLLPLSSIFGHMFLKIFENFSKNLVSLFWDISALFWNFLIIFWTF